jgi:hypothetical protein
VDEYHLCIIIQLRPLPNHNGRRLGINEFKRRTTFQLPISVMLLTMALSSVVMITNNSLYEDGPLLNLASRMAWQILSTQASPVLLPLISTKPSSSSLPARVVSTLRSTSSLGTKTTITNSITNATHSQAICNTQKAVLDRTKACVFVDSPSAFGNGERVHEDGRTG